MELKDVKELIRFIDKSGITEFEFEEENVRLYISKASGMVMAQPTAGMMPMNMPMNMPMQYAPVPAADAAASAGDAAAEDEFPGGVTIKSPIVGTFYEAPAPGAESFVKVGQVVEAGQTLCIVEAMKIMNEIEAEFKCRILKIVASNARPVEYGEPIFIVEKL